MFKKIILASALTANLILPAFAGTAWISGPGQVPPPGSPGAPGPIVIPVKSPKLTQPVKLVDTQTSSNAIPAVDTASMPPDQRFLPDTYKVYISGRTVINHFVMGFNEQNIPVNNDYTLNPGCYITCYSHDAKNGAYEIADNIFINGMVRVAGSYVGRLCKPTGFEQVDLSKETSFVSLCAKLKTCTNDQCWAGGDTGGWFGVQ